MLVVGLRADAAPGPTPHAVINPNATTLLVAVNGDDSNAVRGSTTQPYQTIAAAKNAAQTGDTIQVNPGVYAEAGNLLKNGVNYYFSPGAVVVANVVGLTSTFDDSYLGANGAVTSNITGYGQFFYNNDDSDQTNCFGILRVSNPGSVIKFQAVSTVSTNENNTGLAIIGVTDCKEVFVDVDFIRVAAPHSLNTAVFWGKGDVHVKARRIESTEGYAVWGVEPADGATNDFYLSADFIHGAGYSSLTMDGMTPNWKAWVTVSGEIRTDFPGGLTLGTVAITRGGKLYVTAQKINGNSHYVPAVCATGGELWINAHKLTSMYHCAELRGGTNYISVMDYEDSGGLLSALTISGGRNVIIGGEARVSNGMGVEFTGGTAHLNGLTLNTSATNNTTNRPVTVSANGLYLQNCVLISPASVQSIYAGSSKTVGNLGTLLANRPKHTNITLSPSGFFIVDPNTR